MVLRELRLVTEENRQIVEVPPRLREDARRALRGRLEEVDTEVGRCRIRALEARLFVTAMKLAAVRVMTRALVVLVGEEA